MYKQLLVLFTITLTVFTAGCTTTTVIDPFTKQGLVWPAPPEMARVQFVTEFSDPTDLGIRPSMWSRISSTVAGSISNKMVRPMAVAATTGGQVIYVADPGAQCIHRFDLSKQRYRCLTTESDESLASPVGLAIGDDDRLYMADSGLNRVFTTAPGENSLHRYPLTPPPDQPTGLAVGPSANLFVASTGSHSVRHYGADGSMIREYGGRGDEPGEMNFPTYLWLDSGRELLVTDSMNFRIQIIDPDEGVKSVFGEAGDSTGTFARPKGVAMDRHGHIYVIDSIHHALQIFNRDGQLMLALGEQGSSQGQFWLPSGIFVTEDKLIFVADAYNGRVQVFRYVGEDH